MYKTLIKIIPKKLRNNYIDLIKYNGIKSEPENIIGFVLVFGFIVSLGLAFYPAYVYKQNYYVLPIL